MINPKQLVKGKYYLVEYHNRSFPSTYTCQAVSSEKVRVITKNGSFDVSGRQGHVNTANRIIEISESSAHLRPNTNRDASILLSQKEDF